MLKMFLTFVRGGTAVAEERFADRNALLILDQQMRDAASAFERAKKALAVAIAQDRQETERLAAGQARISDLESRVAAALLAGDEGLARASEAVRQMRQGRIEPGPAHEATLTEAEQTLKRLRERQVEAEAAEAALDELDGAATASVTEKLAAKGFGPRLRTTAEDVLDCLRSRAAAPAH